MVETASEQSIFLRAIELGSPAERSAYLDNVCQGNSGLRVELDALLAAHDRLGGGPPLATQPELLEGGRYQLLEPIGEGGMGTVWLARQSEPVKRLVAIKLIRPGMDSRHVLARFDAERQALALMDHPNIAKVHDAGVTTDGRPFFVMELVKGVPITKYCDEHRLTPRQRLELFVPVCLAIQHAHQKGIIHRDVKPSNVLVALYDDRPVPKVIDFGVAKATGSQLAEQTPHTGFGTVVGTVEYVSPEQASFNQLDVDTRSDVYSLGVLLYELLAGSPPFTRKRLEEAGMLELLRVIREEDPPTPSARLSDTWSAEGRARSANGTGETTIGRGASRSTLRAQRFYELDWIVMKCLEKDRNRRYETAASLAMDVQRYLNDEPVLAGPPSAGYRLRKFARRHKAAFRAAAAFTGVLILGVVISTWQAIRATLAEAAARAAEGAVGAERDRAVLAEAVARTERDKALAAKVRADEEAAIAKAVNNFLQNDLLAEASPDKNARAKQVTVEELLGRASARLAGKFGQQPRIEAAIRQTIGETYRALGNYAGALPHLERALELCRRVLGEEHPDTLTAMNNLAILYQNQGQLPKAEPLYVQSLEVRRRVLGEEHPDTLTAMNNLAEVYRVQGQYAKAEPLYVQSLEVRRRVLGEEHPHTLNSMNNLAMLYQNQGQFTKAEPLLIQTLEVRRRILGQEHPDVLSSMNNLATLYQAQGQYAKAEPLYAQTLEVSRRVLGEEHPETLTAMNNLATLYQAQREYAKAEPLFVQTLEGRHQVLGQEHPDTIDSMTNLAILYRDQRQFLKAEPLLREAVEKTRKRHGEGMPPVSDVLAVLGLNLLQQKKHTEAEPPLRECLQIRQATRPDDWTTFNIQSLLGDSLLGQKKYTEAEALLLASYAGMKQREANIPARGKVRLKDALERLVRLYDATGNKDKAAEWRAHSKELPEP